MEIHGGVRDGIFCPTNHTTWTQGTTGNAVVVPATQWSGEEETNTIVIDHPDDDVTAAVISNVVKTEHAILRDS